MSESKSSLHTPADISTNIDTLAEAVVSSSSPTGIYDVLVVGAGPVGLATAVGLRKRGIENILVIDQTRAFRQVGQVLDILPNGLKAIKYLDPNAYDEVKKHNLGFLNLKQSDEKTNEEPTPTKTTLEWVFKNLQGERIRTVPLGFDEWFQDYGEGRVSLSWYELQTTLRNLLPQDLVKANHRCINVVNEPENECIRLDYVSDKGTEANPYAHWTNGQQSKEVQPQNSDIAYQRSETKSIRAKLIVAADGINSTIRRVLYSDSLYARPEYSGYASIYCTEITDIPNELRAELEEKFFENSPILTICNDEISTEPTDVDGTRMLLFRRPNGQIGYTIHIALPLELLQGKSGSSLVELAVQKFEKASFSDVLIQLVRISPPANMQQRPFYIHRAISSDNNSDRSIKQPAWSAGRVVLVGDAAHGMPPFMAQGANQGLEDALAIVTAIANIAQNNRWDDTQAIATAFEKYERLRRPLMAYVQEVTLKRLPYSSNQKWQEYNEKVYLRNFDRVIEALL
ncbi:FAD-dependent oxidoreductase [Dendronalium sp. ChiSLP03b]|uniref:FAD-dependent oxidoreductase n=1 Tax=Dendronalium sp. ChiSLP03b TaxID=3075381 RepID=UPI002AD33E2B|nr:FAD-dependent monooxygenase [Dendronalium sp. ChiSLP03b]MDZ8204834.1 FAD-dependent monooxygenase [Dendronalium sp. ChiSLP03b]